MQKITIGTRGSALALKQSDIAKTALLNTNPSLTITVEIIKTEGDTNMSPIPLDSIGKGWFTKEIEESLQSGSIDLAVHSLKDLGDVLPDSLAIGAYLPREDARDVLVSRQNESLQELKVGAVIGTDSARRRSQILAMRSDLMVASLRGNVPTRLKKLDDGFFDAIILAAAGLKRLGMENRITHYFDVDEITPAPGQGILALEVRENDDALRALLATCDDTDARTAAHIERTFSKATGGGCKSPTGAYAVREGGIWTLIGAIEDTEGTILREKMSASENDKDTLGTRLAEALLHDKNHAAI